MIKNWEYYNEVKHEFFWKHNSSFDIEIIKEFGIRIYTFTDGAQWMENALNGKVIATENTISTTYQF